MSFLTLCYFVPHFVSAGWRIVVQCFSFYHKEHYPPAHHNLSCFYGKGTPKDFLDNFLEFV
jgi:hypothetical protein